jgi:hypothetical protein
VIHSHVSRVALAGGRTFPIFGAIFGGISGGIILLVSIYFGCIRHPSKKRRLELMVIEHQERIRRVDQELSIESTAEVQRLQDEEQRGLVSAEEERERLAALERFRLANVGRLEAIALEKQRLFEAEQIRLAELEKRRCLEVERQRLPEEERLRLVKADTLKLTEEIQLKLSAEELARLAEAEKARLENQKTVRSLRSRVESVTQTQQLMAGADDAAPAPSTGRIPEERLVPMSTSEGLCPILGGDAEVLHRVSLDCHHAVGAPALSQYLEGSVSSGPFPLRCPLCLDGSPTAGVITESPLRALVAAGVITEELCRSVLVHQIRMNRDQASLEVFFATSKACPFCSIRISHYRGHASHHITPGGGCPSCHNHFCYSCLGHRGVGAAWKGCPNGCRLLCDDTCSCADCPDCQRGTPCVFCSYPSHTECRVCSSP